MTTTVVTTMRKSRRRPRALITTAATAVAAATTTTTIAGAGLLVSPVVTATDPCPMEGGTGWAATADCTQYYFCKNGVNMAGTRYSCEENHLFSVTEMHCKHSSMVHCEAAATAEADSTSSSSLQQQQQAQHETTTEGEGGGSWQSQLYHHEVALENRTSAPTPTPAPTTPRPTKGPDIPRPKYYSDSLTSSCISTYERDPPSWIGEDRLYSSKSECCTVNYNWNPNCLGTDFQEITYSPSSAPTVSSMPSSKPTVTPSSYPTVHPSNTPSNIPSMGPSMSPSNNPTETISKSPSVSPSYKPTPSPTRSPLARGKTASPTLYINQMLTVMDGMDSGGTVSFNPVYGYNNGGQRPVFINKDTTSTTSSSTSFSSSSSSSLMSELILQVAEDATISQQRPDATFGTHAALAVDAGYQGNNERFDSLLKFDISLLDEFQEVESVTLQLYSLGNCEGGSVYTTILDSWTQDSVTWDSAPSQIIDRVGSLGLVTASKWYDVDVTSALTSNTHYTVGSEKFITLRIDTDKNGRCMYAAVDGTDGNGAKLVVKYKSPSSATTGGGDGGMTMQSASTLPTTYPSKTGDFTILRATDDATIDLNDGSGRYGLTPTLNVAFNLNTRDVLDFLVKFDISQMRLLPTKAMFTLFAEVDCPNSGTIMVADIDGPHTQEDWSEESVSYETAPTFHLGQPSVERDLDDYSNTAADIGTTFGPVTAGKWYGADVVRALTDAIRARKSSVTFRVTTSVNASPCQYSSRESGRAPKLMVEF